MEHTDREIQYNFVRLLGRICDKNFLKMEDGMAALQKALSSGFTAPTYPSLPYQGIDAQLRGAYNVKGAHKK